MIKNYLKTALRKLSRNKSYTLINVTGLSIGITCALIIFLIVRQEMNYDNFHSQKDRVYRVTTVWTRPEDSGKNGASQFPLGPAIRSHFSDITVTSINYREGGLFTISNDAGAPKKFQENEGVAYVEPEFFKIFDFPFLQGHPSLLKEPYTVVLSQNVAKKFFPNENPIGKSLRLDNEIDLKVVGITQDPPTTTDFRFTILIAYATQRAAKTTDNFDQWGATYSSINTYLLAPEVWNAGTFEDRVTALAKSFLDERRRKERSYEVQPLSEVHFNPETGSYTYITSRSSLWALSVIGLFLVVTACINFINLATSQAIGRAREIGVRKVLGAFRFQLVNQFIGETFVITFLSAILSVGMTELAVPFLNDAFHFNIRFDLFRDPTAWYFTAALLGFITFGSGFYPAMILSGYQPVDVLKSSSGAKSTGGFWIRKGLVVFQFMIAQALIIGTIVVSNQMDLFQKTDMGFIKEAIVTTEIPVADKSKMETLRSELLKQSGIQNISFGWAPAASGGHWTSRMVYRGKASEPIEVIADVRMADEFYIPTYGIQILAGRNFTAHDTVHELVINEALASKIGFTNPTDAVGETLYLFADFPKPIVGVVKNFNTGSLHENILPMIMGPQVKNYQTMTVKIDMKNSREIIAKIESAWSAAYPEFVFDYQFLDETIGKFYNDEQRVSRLFTIFSFIAIGIGCLGLFGLVSFMAAQRTKEIGVRKVMGASVGDILVMFSKEFVKLILIAFAVAAPGAYFVMNGWLQDFAYRISIGAEVFGLAVALTLIIAGVTVGYRAIKAATANPVDALKYE